MKRLSAFQPFVESLDLEDFGKEEGFRIGIASGSDPVALIPPLCAAGAHQCLWCFEAFGLFGISRVETGRPSPGRICLFGFLTRLDSRPHPPLTAAS